MEHVDFVVVGGGIAGASVGYELAARGSVILLEREATAGYHTTGRSAAVFTEVYEQGPVRALTRAGRSFFEDPPDGFVDYPLFSSHLPLLFVARDDQMDSIAELQASAETPDEVELLEGEALRSVCPVLREDRLAAGLLEPLSMEIDVHELHQAFLRGLRRRQGRVLTGTGVDGLEHDGSTWTVTAGPVTVTTPVVVNASGAWCDDVAELAGVAPIGLVPMRRTAFAFDPEGHDLAGWPMVIDIDEDFYFKPEKAQLMGSLADETPMSPHDVRPDEIDVALAIERIAEATTFEIRHVRRTWAGLRTFSSDRLPVVGFDQDHPGFFWLGGQGGFGIMTSPALSRAATGLICEGVIPPDLADAGVAAADLDPGRFRA